MEFIKGSFLLYIIHRKCNILRILYKVERVKKEGGVYIAYLYNKTMYIPRKKITNNFFINILKPLNLEGQAEIYESIFSLVDLLKAMNIKRNLINYRII
jgi:hypothetical protein